MILQKIKPYLVMGIVGVGLIAPAPSFAETFGPYVSIMGGMNWVAPLDLNQNNFDFVQLELNQPLQSGYTAGLAFGWRFPTGLKPELELSHRKNTLAQFDNRAYQGGGRLDGKGEVQATSVMANLWYEVLSLPAPFGRLTPYIGGGLGYTTLTFSGLEAGAAQYGNVHRDTVLAYQLGTGLGFELNELWSMSLDYRYLQTRDANFGDIQGLPKGDVKAAYRSQSLMLGLQYKF